MGATYLTQDWGAERDRGGVGTLSGHDPLSGHTP